MSRNKRVPRPKGELKRELVEQLQLLRHSCEAYDRGLEAAGKHIALSLRVLLHQHGQSRALLDQLGLRTGNFLDSAGKINPKNLVAECPLVIMQLTQSGGRYIPAILAGGGPFPPTAIPFVEWWNNPILKDDRDNTFCRRDLVQHVADTDGGAHVDPQLDAAYMRLSRDNSLGWMFTENNITVAFRGRPELACMRQIAHEVLSTINQFVAEFREFSMPVIPIVFTR